MDEMLRNLLGRNDGWGGVAMDEMLRNLLGRNDG